MLSIGTVLHQDSFVISLSTSLLDCLSYCSVRLGHVFVMAGIRTDSAFCKPPVFWVLVRVKQCVAIECN